MSKAELHGKLSPDTAHDRMEDLLTSDVFGTMYYAGFDSGFLDWLLQAETTDERDLTIRQFLADSPVREISFSFWPTLPNRREPDLALLFTSQDSSQRVLIIEVKYFSGLSNFAIDDSGGGDEARELTGHQLVDQMIGFSRARHDDLLQNWFDLSPGLEKIPFAHLLITKDRHRPNDIYEEARHFCEDRGISRFPCPAYWLSWRPLACHIEPHIESKYPCRSRLISDLVRLLDRKELVGRPFEAFDQLEWQGPIPESCFWQSGSLFAGLSAINTGAAVLRVENQSVFWKGQP